MYARSLSKPVLESLADTPVIFLRGPRQAGKTTLAKELAGGPWGGRYLTLDDPAVLGIATSDPFGFIAGLEGSVVLDEVQRAPELLLAIKAEVDRDRRPGRFLLTGSADILLLPKASESLAGRMEILTLWPLSRSEISGRKRNLIDRLYQGGPFSLESTPISEDELSAGGYPTSIARTSAARRDAWFGSYVTTILQRDVRDLANIEGLTELPRLLSLLAARACTLMNLSSLSRDIGISHTTLKRYLTLLETTMLVQLLPAWSTNLGKRLVRSPKVLINDSGLMAYLLGLGLGRASRASGALLENFVAMEIKKHLEWSDVRPSLYHFRTHNGSEIDILMEDRAGRVVGIEVKSAATVRARDFAAMKSLADSIGDRFLRGYVIYGGRQSVQYGSNLYALPSGAI